MGGISACSVRADSNKLFPVEPRGWLLRGLHTLDRKANVFYNVPAVGLLALLYVLPVLTTVYLSFHRWTLSARPPVWVGLSNFVDLVEAERFRGALLHTFEYSALAVSIELVLGMVIALILNEPFRGRGFVRTLFLFPMMATPIVTMMAWQLLLDPLTGIFSVIGGTSMVPPLSNEVWALPTLVVVDVWMWTPLVSLILLGGLSALPIEPYEAASLDGASWWQKFWHLTIPMLRPVMVVAVLFRVIDSLKAFEPMFVLTDGGPNFATETLNLYAVRGRVL